MSVTEDFVKLSRSELAELANAGAGPLWLRIALLAYSKVEPNGHAFFGRGKLAKKLGEDRRTIRRAIKQAVEYGYLHETSCTECLVPPLWLVENGGKGKRSNCDADHREPSSNVEEMRVPERASDIDTGHSVIGGHSFPPLSSMSDDRRLLSFPPQAVAR